MPEQISEYKVHRCEEHASPSTINRELALMKHAYHGNQRMEAGKRESDHNGADGKGAATKGQMVNIG